MFFTAFLQVLDAGLTCEWLLVPHANPTPAQSASWQLSLGHAASCSLTRDSFTLFVGMLAMTTCGPHQSHMEEYSSLFEKPLLRVKSIFKRKEHVGLWQGVPFRVATASFTSETS